MNVRSKVERLERRAPKVTPAGDEECETCASLRRGLSLAYGAQVEPFGCAPGKCEETRRNLLRIYGGNNDDGLKAAA